MPLSRAKRAFLVDKLGEERVARLEAELAVYSSALKSAGVGFKDVGEMVFEAMPGTWATDFGELEQQTRLRTLVDQLREVLAGIMTSALEVQEQIDLLQQAVTDFGERLKGIGTASKASAAAPSTSTSPVAGYLAAIGLIGEKQGDVAEGTWDADKETAALRRWASSDGSGDVDKMDWAKYGRAFAVKKGAGDKFGDFSFPHHVVRDGELVLHGQGLQAAWAAARGGRAGEPNQEAQAHLGPHREALGMGEDSEKQAVSPARPYLEDLAGGGSRPTAGEFVKQSSESKHPSAPYLEDLAMGRVVRS